MIRPNVDYLYLYPYKYDYEFEKMSNKFLKSNLNSLIKKENHSDFKENVLSFAKTDPYGYRYVERYQKTQKIIMIKNLLII